MTAPFSASTPPSTPAAGWHVLVVDDDPSICLLYVEILRGEGYEVISAGSRAEALAEIERLDGAIDVLVLDISLPDADGADLAREIVAKIGQRPTLVSGWTDGFWNLSMPGPVARDAEANPDSAVDCGGGMLTGDERRDLKERPGRWM